MKFGVRQCANIVFRAKQVTKIGTNVFNVGQPVLYIDTATTSSMEQASSTVYAQGGRGNARLIAWQGDKTLTFTVTDALISPVSLSMLSGAGLVKESDKYVHVHATTAATLTIAEGGTTSAAVGTIDITEALLAFGNIDNTTGHTDSGTGAAGPDRVRVDVGTDAPLYIILTEDDGSITGDLITGSISEAYTPQSGSTPSKYCISITNPRKNGSGNVITTSQNVLIDYYVIKKAETVSEIQLTAADFAGYYYVEADTLFRSQSTGIDMPANLTFPNVKVQSGFTISMAGTGDPSTFDFTMDAFPGYTYFDKSKQVLCVIQVVEDSQAAAASQHSVMLSNSALEHSDPLGGDSARTSAADG